MSVFVLLRRRFVLGLVALGVMVSALIFGGTPGRAADQEREMIGTVTRLQGEGFAFLDQDQRPLAVNSPLYRLDTVGTGAQARMEITLIDGAVITLGAEARMLLSDLLVTQSPQPRGPVLSLIRGAFALASPKTKGADIATPVATIGIRGTQVWGGSLDNAVDILLLEGKIEVFNAQGRVFLDQAGQGTAVPTPGQAPNAASYWPDDKVRRAVATVTFDADLK
jgi:hypothetical protein